MNVSCLTTGGTKMEDLYIEKTVKTPLISAKSSGTIEMQGICVPEDSFEFFEPLKQWIDRYVQSPAAETIIEIKLDYFNTSTARILLNLFRILEAKSREGVTMKINWHFESGDIEMREAGNDYKALLTIPFELFAFD